MVEILRNKWCEDLEDMLQCPVCLVCQTNVQIYQCIAGHLICQSCKKNPQLASCPICRSSWSSYRNRLAEDLCSKFDDIKLSLIDPEAEINKLLIPDKLCVSTQTDNTDIGTAFVAAVEAIESQQQVSDGHAGSYPCCVGTCEVKMGYESLLEHIKSQHFMHFQKLPLQEDCLLFTYTWAFECTEEMKFDRVFCISDVGTFILKLSTDKCGDLTGYVTMLHGGFVSKQFTYQLTINGKDGSCPAYIGNMNSCRSPAKIFQENCLRLKNADMQVINQSANGLRCTFSLARRLQLDEGPPSRVNGLSKRHRNRGKSSKTAARETFHF